MEIENKKARQIIFLFVSLLLIFSLKINLSMSAESSAKEILDKIDDLWRGNSSISIITMTVKKESFKRTLTLKSYTKGKDLSLIIIKKPLKEAGISTLKVKNNIYNYLPKTGKIIKIPSSMMMGSWMGSDFTNDDLVKESTLFDDYTSTLIEPPGADAGSYYVELKPKQQTASVWGRIVLVVRKSDFIPIREEYYDERGNKMRVLEFKDVKELGGRKMPTVLELTPLNKEGKKTVIRYIKAEFDMKLDPATFTLRNLRKRR